ncbi:putative anaerobic ribonucleotide reductase activating protein [Staphylococcus piscifermentans]|uniref:Anaerobic ribonucleoside-triphosphate reductase-activating protein n=1 Tax=Staphylococcus piscifermentans TaxID=70258 RepID=A0A239TQB4_9STAP|nr:anaerobic ribonucleoside-triphosphate reductase activating protein [Staphylococcus piscifermentans]RTX85964.1 anaerobic ribonucleoside-triphosphate reductase activating protein [Staphylococcus piscifermentans]GEP85670.1 anaerobic ribonucleoside-triphosphate reductase-activating protein [Staphylococcus piscifermentans]SNU99732.1 putative anaerobic ribonucleotide reductase activating protein [Staphylococcus piscifermentans]
MFEQLETGQGYIAKIERESFTDGEGVRCSVYVSGCPFNCKGCYNQASQQFTYGEPFNHEVLVNIIEACSPSYIAGLSILGGEPFCNLDTVEPIVQAFRNKFGDEKSIWIWSGFIFEALQKKAGRRGELLKEIDVLVDGPFMEQLYQPGLAYKGSLNQRVIDVQTSLKACTVIEY